MSESPVPATTTSATTTSASAAAAPSSQRRKGFGLPYPLDIEALRLDGLELHTQDFLNASHAADSSASVIRLKSLSMNHRDLTKPPKADSTATDNTGRTLHSQRRPLYLDDVVWRLVNKLLAELLKYNSIAMMVLLSSAAANRTSSVVSSAANRTSSVVSSAADCTSSVVSNAGSLAYQGAATGGKLLSTVGSALVGGGSSAKATSNNNSTAATVPTTNTTTAVAGVDA